MERFTADDAREIIQNVTNEENEKFFQGIDETLEKIYADIRNAASNKKTASSIHGTFIMARLIACFLR